MRWAILVLTVLAGCDSPGFGFSAAEVTRIDAGGHAFSLRRSGNVVQAIRTNFVRRPDINLIGRDAELAIERTYGCRVTKMRGDVALMVAQLDCERAPRDGDWARWVKPRRSLASCLGHISSGQAGRRKEIDLVCF